MLVQQVTIFGESSLYLFYYKFNLKFNLKVSKKSNKLAKKLVSLQCEM